MSKKYLRKNEFRIDINPIHLGKSKKPHPAYISAKCGHKYKANSITHSRTINGIVNFDVFENPDKRSKDTKRKTRVSAPYWQNENQFGDKLNTFRFSRKTRNQIKKFNKKFYK